MDSCNCNMGVLALPGSLPEAAKLELYLTCGVSPSYMLICY